MNDIHTTTGSKEAILSKWLGKKSDRIAGVLAEIMILTVLDETDDFTKLDAVKDGKGNLDFAICKSNADDRFAQMCKYVRDLNALDSSVLELYGHYLAASIEQYITERFTSDKVSKHVNRVFREYNPHVRVNFRDFIECGAEPEESIPVVRLRLLPRG